MNIQRTAPSTPLLKRIGFSKVTTLSILCFAMQWSSAHADETTLGIHTLSYHNGGNYNENTPGLYLERNNFVLGAYHNSIRNTSVYGGYTWTWPLPPNPIVNAISFTGGLVTGYRHKGYNSDIAVLAATSIRHDLDNRQALRLSILPLHKRSAATYVLHLSYEVKLKN
jgi:hypothetical protein